MTINQIDPLQPYFVLNTRLYKKMIPEHSPVAHFYQFTYTEQNPVINGVVPDGAVDMIFDTDDGSALVSGSVKSVIETMFQPKHTYFGVRFKPGVLEHYGTVSVSELVGNSVPLSDVVKCGISENIADCTSFRQRTETIDRYISDLFSKEETAVPELVRELISCIYDRNGDVTVHELEEALFYSRRHLLRVFKMHIGMDIKSFCQIVRFQSVLSELHSRSCTSLTESAQNHGYYDQTHFQKEFKKFAFLSPKAYVGMLKQNAYHSRIQCC